MDTFPAGFTAPVCQALLTPMKWHGVPRTPGMLNVLVGVAAVVALHWVWYLPVVFGIHWGLRLATKWDPYFVQVLARAMQSYDFYDV